jgi:sulfur transfer complex TusBCD TusB component (DsrH family)
MFDGCYKKHDVVLTWIDAAVTAVQNSATLASIHSEAHNRWVAEHLRRVGWANADLWLGASDITKEGVWAHADGSAFDFSFWAGYQPDNYNGKQNCVFLSPDTPWYDDYCWNGRPSLMKWNTSARQLLEGKIACTVLFVAVTVRFVPAPTPPSLSCSSLVWSDTITCPSGFVYMFDGCYKKHDVVLTWIDAAVTAVQENATLASIHSEPHNRWLSEHLQKVGWLTADLWIGANDIALEGTWANVDDSSFDFSFWAQNEPNNVNGAENCALYSTNTYWYDGSCYSGKRSLLKSLSAPTYTQEG